MRIIRGRAQPITRLQLSCGFTPKVFANGLAWQADHPPWHGYRESVRERAGVTSRSPTIQFAQDLANESNVTPKAFGVFVAP
jgi:hypothetical protein